MTHALISLGSNLGDRRGQLSAAFAALAELPRSRLVRRSRLYASAPAGGPGRQGEFLNGAALLHTALSPAELLAQLQRIEQQAARRRDERWAARTLDLDLLLFGEAQQGGVDLALPHPRMSCRRFVLDPAADIAATMLHPPSGWTVGSLARQLHRRPRVEIAARDPEQAAALVRSLELRIADASFAGFPVKTTLWRPAPGRRLFPPLTALILAICDDARCDETVLEERSIRKRLALPSAGPVAWLGRAGMSLEDEAAAAVSAALTPLG